MNKKILSIDASSSAIGWAIMSKENEDTTVIKSGVIDNYDMAGEFWKDRVNAIREKMKSTFPAILNECRKHDVQELVMNLGYVQTNGVDVSALSLQLVQNKIIDFFAVQLDFTYTPMLDISWLSSLAKYNNWKGNKNDLKNRSIKKLETVKAAIKIKGHKLEDIVKVNKAEYNYVHMYKGDKDKEATLYGEVMFDDEADAIFCGYAYLNGEASETTLISKRMKLAIDQLESSQSKLNSTMKRVETINKHIKQKKSEIETYTIKHKEKPSVVNTKAILNREKEIMQLQNELLDLEPIYYALENKIAELKSKMKGGV